MKGQSQIIQYVLFFLIGLSIFGIVGNFYKSQADSLRETIDQYSREMLASYISGYAIHSFTNCKLCNNTNVSLRTPNKTASYYHEFYLLKENGLLEVKSVPSGKHLFSTIHNLNETLTFYGFSSSIEPIVLSYIKNQNKLLVS